MSDHERPRSVPRLALTLLALAPLLLAGCPRQGPRPSEYERFRTSIATLQSRSDALFGTSVQWAREGLVNGQDPTGMPSFSELMLTVDEADPFRTTQAARPFYQTIEQLQDGLFELNQALLDYASQLALLAGGTEADAARIDALAADLNLNLQTSSTSLAGLGAGTPALSPEVTGLVSALSAAAFTAYVERQRVRALRDVLDKGQPVVDEYAGLATAAIQIVASDITNTYSAWARVEGRRYIGLERELASLEARRADLTPDEGRRLDELREDDAAARLMIIERNDAVRESLRSLGRIHAAFERLPGAHRALRAALDEDRDLVDALRSYYEDVRRVEQQYRKLTSSVPE